jgi:hypothetical protein
VAAWALLFFYAAKKLAAALAEENDRLDIQRGTVMVSPNSNLASASRWGA